MENDYVSDALDEIGITEEDSRIVCAHIFLIYGKNSTRSTLINYSSGKARFGQKEDFHRGLRGGLRASNALVK
jgi:hypothetical protein